MEQQIKEWINAHKKEIAIVAITAVIALKFAPHRNVAYIQDADGSYVFLPLKQG
jgi:hypothetical protein